MAPKEWKTFNENEVPRCTQTNFRKLLRKYTFYASKWRFIFPEIITLKFYSFRCSYFYSFYLLWLYFYMKYHDAQNKISYFIANLQKCPESILFISQSEDSYFRKLFLYSLRCVKSIVSGYFWRLVNKIWKFICC